MRFEKQLEALKTKDDLHRWVDTLPDEVELKGIMIVGIDDAKEEDYLIRFRELGDITIAEQHYLLWTFLQWLSNIKHAR